MLVIQVSEGLKTLNDLSHPQLLTGTVNATCTTFYSWKHESIKVMEHIFHVQIFHPFLVYEPGNVWLTVTTRLK